MARVSIPADEALNASFTWRPDERIWTRSTDDCIIAGSEAGPDAEGWELAETIMPQRSHFLRLGTAYLNEFVRRGWFERWQRWSSPEFWFSHSDGDSTNCFVLALRLDSDMYGTWRVTFARNSAGAFRPMEFSRAEH